MNNMKKLRKQLEDIKEALPIMMKLGGIDEAAYETLNASLDEALQQCFDSKAVCKQSKNCTFEYRIIDHNMFDEDEMQIMNSMGSNGWEIVRVLDPMKYINSDGLFIRIYYKREKQSE